LPLFEQENSRIFYILPVLNRRIAEYWIGCQLEQEDGRILDRLPVLDRRMTEYRQDTIVEQEDGRISDWRMAKCEQATLQHFSLTD
jgi:hypothetical protein